MSNWGRTTFSYGGARNPASAPSDENAVGAPASGVPRISLVDLQFSIGVGFLVNINHTETPSEGLLDFMDFNGDRFPDVVGGGIIQYTNMRGGLGGDRFTPTSSAPQAVRNAISIADNIAPGGTVQKTNVDGKGRPNTPQGRADAPSHNANFGFTGSLGTGTNEMKEDYQDINGDGLPDRVTQSGSQISVALNLGYEFATPEPWGTATLDDGKSLVVNAGVSFNDGVKGYAGSITLTNTLGETVKKLIDINGDGLLDRVSDGSGGLSIMLNTGNGFAPAVAWGGGDPGSSQSFSANGGVSSNYNLGPLCLVACFTDINPSVSYAHNLSRAESSLQDVNGDGYPDYVASTDESEMKVGVSLIGKTHLLREIKRPLGAGITLDYKREGNTYRHPHSKWVLSETRVFDGFAADNDKNEGADYQRTGYAYEDGYYNRYERDFYGFATVTETQYDTTGFGRTADKPLSASPAYRRVVRTYRNDNYFARGLLVKEQLFDTSNELTKTENDYELWDVTHKGVYAFDPSHPTSGDGYRVFPRLTKETRTVFEPGYGAKSTWSEYGYDENGNVTDFRDTGENGKDGDDAVAAIDYWNCPDSYIIGKARKIVVTDGSHAITDSAHWMRHRESIIDCKTGQVDQIDQSVDGKVATTRLTYDEYGNLQSVTSPPNQKGDLYTLTYAYDPAVHTHIAGIRDNTFGTEGGVTASALHNYLYGKPARTTDVNGNNIHYLYDDFGRTKAIYGPYEAPGTSENLGTTTLEFLYDPEAVPPVAKTRHLDKFNPGDTLDTYLFTDGLKRVIQTKKDAAIAKGDGSDTDTRVVTGRVVFDGLGRTTKEYDPKVDDKEKGTTFDDRYGTYVRTHTTFDTRDRTTDILFPDGTSVHTNYAIKDKLLETQVTDQEENVSKSYRDIRALIRKVIQIQDGADYVTTTYGYNVLKEITDVWDTKQNHTEVKYDQLGRRTEIFNLDTGKVESKRSANPILAQGVSL